MFLSTVHRTMTAMGFLVCRFGRFYVQFVCCLYCSLYQPTVAANVTSQQKNCSALVWFRGGFLLVAYCWLIDRSLLALS